MALLMVKIEKEDINTCKIGVNIMIETDKFNLIFSRDALDEFILDYNKIKEEEDNG